MQPQVAARLGDCGVFVIRAASLALSPAPVEHLPGAVASAGDAELVYAIVRGDGATSPQLVIDMQHTVTPAAARGRGLAGVLTLAAVRGARAAGVCGVLPSCTYTAGFLSRSRGAAAPGALVAVGEELRLRVPAPPSARWSFE